MAGDELFGDLPEQMKPQTDPAPLAAPRLREPERDQVEWRPASIDSLIGEYHPARIIWDLVSKYDLSDLEKRIKARGSKPGHPTVSPRLMLALWVYATSEGVGSARALDRLCKSHNAYCWLCGGVSVNYHTLADFRLACTEVLDRLLTDILVALHEAGLIALDTLAQDGVKIRAGAGTSSFRRAETLEQKLEAAQAVVEELKREAKEHPEASNKRIRAARERAARERVERVQAAKAALEEVKDKRKQLEEKGGNGKKPREPRASTTDAHARVMKMADAGFRPAYNIQVASVAGTQIIAAVDVDNNGSDRGLMKPMLEKLHKLKGCAIRRHIVDGGFCCASDIEWAHRQGTAVYCPPTKSKTGVDPYQPRDTDGEGGAIWRVRMASDAGKALYALRVICECIHARWRNWGLRQVTVRGREKVRAVVTLYAFTNNLLQGFRMTMENFLATYAGLLAVRLAVA
jgi:transposase